MEANKIPDEGNWIGDQTIWDKSQDENSSECEETNKELQKPWKTKLYFDYKSAMSKKKEIKRLRLLDSKKYYTKDEFLMELAFMKIPGSNAKT